MIEKGTIVVRDGVIEAVGADVKPPADARVIDLAGKTAYAGLVDAYSEITIGADVVKQGAPAGIRKSPRSSTWPNTTRPTTPLNTKLRSQGIAARLVAPAAPHHQRAEHRRFDRRRRKFASDLESRRRPALSPDGPLRHERRENYPNSPMGAVALARQTHARRRLVRQGLGRLAKTTASCRGPNATTRWRLSPTCAAGNQLAIIDAANEQFVLRADRFAREFGLKAIIRGSGREYRRLAEVAATGRSDHRAGQLPAARPAWRRSKTRSMLRWPS